MPSIEILGKGRIDERDSAFPQAVQLPNGDLLCSFNAGGGAIVAGGSDWARSTGGGETWTLEGTILPRTDNPRTTNALKLSISPEGVVFAYGSRAYPQAGHGFGHVRNEPVFCTFDGVGWSSPTVVPMPADCPLEISHGILPLSSGRLLAPAATLPAQGRLGEQVIVAISDDGGRTWPRHAVVFQDPEKKLGFFEQKLADIGQGRVIATCWTVTLEGVEDRPNCFAISEDRGSTWGPAMSTGINGQTMTPIPLGQDRLLVLYNRRYGDQAIMMALVTFTDESWTVRYEGVLYDANQSRQRPDDTVSGVDELDGFTFGFPTAVMLQDGTIFATYWSREDGKNGVSWTKLAVDW
ncbi:MAG: exo-alpha-sialidase [Chloroflexi bacterium]|nr:exo-alpha-sialidase [Chloroflexota bacterium]